MFNKSPDSVEAMSVKLRMTGKIMEKVLEKK